jgi:hypothetical protein
MVSKDAACVHSKASQCRRHAAAARAKCTASADTRGEIEAMIIVRSGKRTADGSAVL